MFTSHVSILFAQSKGGKKRRRIVKKIRAKKIKPKEEAEEAEAKESNDEKQKNQISFCQLIQFLPIGMHVYILICSVHILILTRTTEKKQTIARIASGIRRRMM